MIAILDYGCGNVRAFLNAYERMKIPCRAARSAADLEGVRQVILPGVGAFDTAMRLFTQSGMRDVVQQRVLEQNIPLLGVCVGMQMLADSSEEGKERGLGWIPGKVCRIPTPTGLRLPHMGWNQIAPAPNNRLLRDLPAGGRFYFLHSYYFECADAAYSGATVDYGATLTCAVHRERVFGVQFHPEKSHEDGMKLLKNFAET